MELRPARSSRAVGRLRHVGGSGEGPWVADTPRRRIELTRPHGFLPVAIVSLAGLS